MLVRQRRVCVNVTIVNDKEVEDTELFRMRMTFTAVGSPRIIPRITAAVITIYDDDCTPKIITTTISSVYPLTQSEHIHEHTHL